MAIQLSDHFDYKRMLRFTLPSIAMTIFTAVYSIVDGFFVSNYVGKIPFAAIGLIAPLQIILGAVGSMIGSGGNALIAKTLGEGNRQKANNLFSFLTYTMFIIGAVMSAIAYILLPDIMVFLGAKGEILTECIAYGKILMFGAPFLILQYAFQGFFVTAEKPKLGLFVVIGAGIANMILDALLVVVFPLGIRGAALATVISQCLGGVIPIFFFASKKNNWLLRLGKGSFDGKALVQSCFNGSSEFMSNVSASVIALLFNAQLLKYAGNDGVAAYGAIMYVNMIFNAVFFGFSMGISPVISYHYGAENQEELKNLLKRCSILTVAFSVLMYLASVILARPFALLYVGYDAALMEMTLHGFRIYSFSFLVCGISTFASAFFTALNNGLVSALISTMKSFVFPVVFVLLLPAFWKLDGIWCTAVFSQILAALVGIGFVIANKKKYQYL